ncbi:hypothetical protein EC991_004317 [Linnemannia zychae]|nr:hypothetical protein EC991_004317 [Linnemannia zychae]
MRTNIVDEEYAAREPHDVAMTTSAHTHLARKIGEDEDEDEIRNEVDTEMQANYANDDNQGRDSVRRKLGGRRRQDKKEKAKSSYDSDDDEDLQTIERSMQRCIEAANAVIAIVENFDDIQIKYHGGNHIFTIYLAGTIPYWKETDERAKALRDLLSSHSKQQRDHSDEDDDDEDRDDEDDKDGDDYSGGAEDDDDQKGDYSGAEDDSGAEQSISLLFFLATATTTARTTTVYVTAHTVTAATATFAFRIVAVGVSSAICN